MTPAEEKKKNTRENGKTNWEKGIQNSEQTAVWDIDGR